MVTELKPDLRKLPFEEFVNMMCRPMVERDALEVEVANTFPMFSGGAAEITKDSLSAAMAELGRPVDPLVVRPRAAALARPACAPSCSQCCAWHDALPPSSSPTLLRAAAAAAATTIADARVSRRLLLGRLRR